MSNLLYLQRLYKVIGNHESKVPSSGDWVKAMHITEQYCIELYNIYIDFLTALQRQPHMCRGWEFDPGAQATHKTEFVGCSMSPLGAKIKLRNLFNNLEE